MKWERVKLVVIAILLLACIILGWNIWSLTYSRRYIDEEMLSDVRAILAADDIHLADGAVPAERFRADVFVGATVEDYYQYVYNALSGDPIYRTYTTPDGLMIFTDGGDRYHISGNFGFAYYAAGFLTVNLPKYGELSMHRLTEDQREELLSSVREFLKMDALLSSDMAERYQLVLTGARITSDQQGYYVSVNLTMDGVPLVTNEAVLLIRGQQVRAMAGTWTFLSGDRTEAAPIYDQVNILISEKKNVDADRLSGAFAGSVSIERIEPCYCPYVSEESGAVYFVPGWKITYGDGQIRVYDGVSNQIYPMDAVIPPS